MPNFRIGAIGNRQQHAFAGEDRNAVAIMQVMRGRDFFGAPQQRSELARTRERLGVRVRILRWPRPLPLGRFFVAAPLLVVEFDPVMPALRADAADLLQIFLDAVLFRPIFREPLPIVDVHSSELAARLCASIAARLSARARSLVSRCATDAGSAPPRDCCAPGPASLSPLRRPGEPGPAGIPLPFLRPKNSILN